MAPAGTGKDQIAPNIVGRTIVEGRCSRAGKKNFSRHKEGRRRRQKEGLKVHRQCHICSTAETGVYRQSTATTGRRRRIGEGI
jgi:hypothetical protein